MTRAFISGMSTIRRILFSIAVVVALLALIMAMSLWAFREVLSLRRLPDDAPYRRGVMFDAGGRTGPIDFFSAGHAFTMPIEFLFMLNYSTYDPGFIVSLTYPGLRAKDVDDMRCRNYGTCDFATVIVVEEEADRTQTVTDLPQRFARYTKIPFGNGLVQVASTSQYQWYYHAPENAGDPPAMVACAELATGHSCRVTAFRDAMQFEVEFPFRDLPQWRRIVDESVGFVVAHIVPPTPEDIAGLQRETELKRRGQ
ncbi:hypothetical protein [Lichenicola sp.]|uniref:hypothetical protein n=1 Tax=Lichenicola sp. TaxID=2804529 RepID=UPI003B000197